MAAAVSPLPNDVEALKTLLAATLARADMSMSMHMLARRHGRSLQALMAGAFNDVLRKHVETPMGK